MQNKLWKKYTKRSYQRFQVRNLVAENILKKILALLESVAYPIAFWNILILFFEPIIGHYLYVSHAQYWTALINLIYIVFTLLTRLFSTGFYEYRNRNITDLLIIVFGSLLFIYDPKFVVFFLLIRQIFFIARYATFYAYEGALYKKLVKNPPVTFLVSFAVTILSGSALLMLPSATTAHKVTHFIDALFTATSATCVTGLTVVDTGTYYSLFGQLVILALIQIGGLGIMTISTAFAILLGQKLTLKVENVMQNVMGESKSFDMITLVKNVILLTIIIEAIGAVVLFTKFVHLHTPAKALYFSIFHSVSAFCNAGFGLYTNNLMSFAFDFRVNMAITLLIILGGLGFPVIVDIYNHLLKKSNRYSLTLHTKIVISTTIFLLLFGVAAFFISEFNHTMKGFSFYQRLICSWFQSVTCRTAGFNTIDESQISHASALVSIILMFIGASPGSTGGGVKTSTFAVLILSIVMLIRGHSDLNVFKRKIGSSSILESTSLIILSMLCISFIVFAILIIDSFTLEQTMFEAVSAFGTVGLSMGITSQLSSISKFLIVLLMYIGRVGPLTVLFALSQRKKPPHYTLAEEKITIG
jgi:trk system potassium uptake protein TrkH